MQVNFVEGVIKLEGQLTEQSSRDVFKKFILDAQGTGHSSVLIDFSKVTRANSCGLMEFISAIYDAKTDIEYINCPVWLVDQFNEVDELLPDHCTVKSVFAPFVNEDDGSVVNLIIPIVDDFDSSETYAKLEEMALPDGKKLTPDFDKEEYFYFTTKRSR